MLLIEEIVAEEKIRIENMIHKYSDELDKLPRGTLTEKNIRGKKYVYLQFREGKKVLSKYIGTDVGKIESVKQLLDRRKQIEEILAELEAEYKLSKKIVE